MITGHVTNHREAVVTVQLRDTENRLQTISAVVDTGFNGFLTLPYTWLGRFRHAFTGTTRVELGDGRNVDMDMYYVHAHWEGRECEIVAITADGGPLLGMALLENHRLSIEIRDHGPVRIESLSEGV